MGNIEIIPLIGMVLNDIRIALSASRQEVENLLGKPYGEWKSSWFYFNNELRFDFNEDDKVEFIEFLGGINGKIQPQIYGVYAFQVEADHLYSILVQKNNGDMDDHENGYSYGFLNSSVGVYRISTPECVQEMIEEAEDDGDPMDSDDIEFEMRKANHWNTIGFGTKNYYR